MKMELLTNATVVDDAIRFRPEKSSSNLKDSVSTNPQKLKTYQQDHQL